MNFKEFRKMTGLSQKKFSEYFHIPIGTVQAWEIERCNPPSYVFELMIKVWDYEQDKRIEEYKKEAQKKFIEKILNG